MNEVIRSAISIGKAVPSRTPINKNLIEINYEAQIKKEPPAPVYFL